MKTSLISLALAATLLAGHLTADTAHAQHDFSVRVIDLNYVFKNYGLFTAQRDRMKAKIDQAEARVQAAKDELQKLAQRIGDLPLGNPDRNRLEEEHAQRTADLQLQIAKDKKEFLREEAHIYYNTYQAVLQEIQYFCERNNVGLVLRFNGDPIDPNSPQQVLQEVNKPILYVQREVDITPIILESLNNRRPGSSPPVTPSGGTTDTRSRQLVPRPR